MTPPIPSKIPTSAIPVSHDQVDPETELTIGQLATLMLAVAGKSVSTGVKNVRAQVDNKRLTAKLAKMIAGGEMIEFDQSIADLEPHERTEILKSVLFQSEAKFAKDLKDIKGQISVMRAEMAGVQTLANETALALNQLIEHLETSKTSE